MLPNNFFVLNPFAIGAIGRLTILLLVPLVITWTLFDPFATYALKSNTNEVQNIHISATEINKNLAPYILSGIFQTTLDLGWYQICFENSGALSMGRLTVMNRADRGDVVMHVKQGGYSESDADYVPLTARPFEKQDCARFNVTSEGIFVGTSTVALGARENDRPEDYTQVSPDDFQFTVKVDLRLMNLYARQDWIAFLIKYFLIAAAWAGLILLIENLYFWVSKRSW